LSEFLGRENHGRKRVAGPEESGKRTPGVTEQMDKGRRERRGERRGGYG